MVMVLPFRPVGAVTISFFLSWRRRHLRTASWEMPSSLDAWPPEINVRGPVGVFNVIGLAPSGGAIGGKTQGYLEKSINGKLLDYLLHQ